MARTEACTPDEARRLIGRVFDEVWNQGNVDVVGEIFAEGQVGHSGNGTEMTVTSFKETVLRQRATSPELHYLVDQFVVDGPWISTLWTGTGIARDDGSTVSRWGITIWRLDGNKIGEAWVVTSETPSTWQ
jgi:predicted ester cyclase